MNPETRTCQNCKNNFVIEPQDFAFYASVDVPPPTFCPECRLIRKLAFFNERALYKGTCQLCEKKMISQFHPAVPITVYCYHCWWSDNWNSLDYGMEVDFSRPFLEQVKELVMKIPWASVSGNVPTLVNSEYGNVTSYMKNCYMMFNSDYDEECLYGGNVEYSKECVDCYLIDHSELCYNSVNVQKCQRAINCVDCEESFDIYFSRNLVGCSNCFGCVNLRKKSYCIFNEQYSKEEYTQKLAEFRTDSYVATQELKAKLGEFFLRFPNKYMHGRHNQNTTGDYIYGSKNVLNSVQVLEAEDSRYCHYLTFPHTKDSYDMAWWGGNTTRDYECMASGGGQNNVKFSYYSWGEAMQDIEYSMYIRTGCSNNFGCVGLRNKQYCILNKQYSKEAFDELRPRIIHHMKDMPYVDALGRTYAYGEFFPFDLSLFAYNETAAQEHFPLTKEAALAKGYAWRDPEKRDYKITVEPHELPDSIQAVDDRIVDEIIGCEHAGTCTEKCTEAFKITPAELAFYKKLNLPIPRLCPNCRHYARLKERNPMKLWRRKCMKNSPAGECQNEFETSYSPDRPEMIYCESCFQQEMV